MLLILLASTAAATWSIVATDAETGEIGGAGTSCVGSIDTVIMYAGVPGVGAVHAQAQINTDGRDEAARLLGEDSTPREAMDAITDASFDEDAALRQYGIVDLSGGAVAFTGSSNPTWAGDVRGHVGSFTYSAQGNTLTGAAVVTGTVAAFRTADGDLADKLMHGLEAGASDGGGDSRCTRDGIPSDSAFIRVQATDGSDIVLISVVATRPESALVALRDCYDAWQLGTACPEDTGSPDDDTDALDAAACTCAVGPTGTAWLALPLLGLVRRRRASPRPGTGRPAPDAVRPSPYASP